MAKGPQRYRHPEGHAVQRLHLWGAADTTAPSESELQLNGGVSPYLTANSTGQAQLAYDADTVRVGGVASVSAAASSAVTNTTAQTDFDVTYDIPANTLEIGSVIEIWGYVEVGATNSTDTLLIKLLLDADEIIATAAVDVADADICFVHAVGFVRSIGASGDVVWMVDYQDPDVTGTAPKCEAKVDATVDTTQALTVKAAATWSVKSTANSCTLELLAVKITK